MTYLHESPAWWRRVWSQAQLFRDRASSASADAQCPASSEVRLLFLLGPLRSSISKEKWAEEGGTL